MSIAVIALSESGFYLAKRIYNTIDDTALLLPVTYDLDAQMATDEGIEIIADSRLAKSGGKYWCEQKLSEIITAAFGERDAIIAIMALGIVARLTAPLLIDKYHDPAIVVVDEGGRYAISALSGHEGGANLLSVAVASAIGAEPVITTASETRKTLAVGVGCRRGIKSSAVESAIKATLKAIDRDLSEVRWMATIDIKRDEKGLLEASKVLNTPIRYFTKPQIEWLGSDYTGSDTARRHLGVKGVSEPCALLAAPGGRLLIAKSVMDGVTVAIAEVKASNENSEDESE